MIKYWETGLDVTS